MKSINEISKLVNISFEGNLISDSVIEDIARTGASEQAPQDYGLQDVTSIRDEIMRAFRKGKSVYGDFKTIKKPSQETTNKFIRSLFEKAFGFHDLATIEGSLDPEHQMSLDRQALGFETDDRYLVAGGHTPFVIVCPFVSLTKRLKNVFPNGYHSPSSYLQSVLNQGTCMKWGIATNGHRIRLMRLNTFMTKQVHMDANLDEMFENDDLASFSLLWQLIHRSRFPRHGADSTDCALERWRGKGLYDGVRIKDKLAVQVELAARVLGTGFIRANPSIAEKLKSGELSVSSIFNELLRLIYRMIFLMVAEDRELLHPVKPVNVSDEDFKNSKILYANGYSLDYLRKMSRHRTNWDKHHDRYEAMKVVFRALSGNDTDGVVNSELKIPVLGGLFDADGTMNVDSARLMNKAFMEAVYNLSWIYDRSGISLVNWRNMATEELGSVYETLLDLKPILSTDGMALEFASDRVGKKGTANKTTGSYYTPEDLVRALLDTTLKPVIDKIESDDSKSPMEKVKALLNLSVIDPACGSGHFLLAVTRQIAERVTSHRIEMKSTSDDYNYEATFRKAMREVAGGCIHGVDKNPMAVELAKVAMWIETVDPGPPLRFFDANIRCGDSLFGVFEMDSLRKGIPDDAYKQLFGDDKDIAKSLSKANKVIKSGQEILDYSDRTAVSAVTDEYHVMCEMPEDTQHLVRAKHDAYNDWRNSPEFKQLKLACDLYISAFLIPKTENLKSVECEIEVPTSKDVWEVIGTGKVSDRVRRSASFAENAGAFHWPVEFPDVHERGGFDIVIGNPPWETLVMKEAEFFAERSTEIAEASPAAFRKRLIRNLSNAQPGTAENKLYEDFKLAKRNLAAISSFARLDSNDGGRYPLTGRGEINTYSIFSELFTQLSTEGGCVGIIVPTGIATDSTTSTFFRYLIEEGRLSSLYDFENKEGFFPNVDTRFRFSLLTIGHDIAKPKASLFLHGTEQLNNREREFTLSSRFIKKFNPNTGTMPMFRSLSDSELALKIYNKFPILLDKHNSKNGNPWGASFTCMFHMAGDSEIFFKYDQLVENGFTRQNMKMISEEPFSDKNSRLGTEIHDMFGDSPGVNDSCDSIYLPLYEAKMVYYFDHRWFSFGDDDFSAIGMKGMDEGRSWESLPRYWVPQREVNVRIDECGWNHDWLLGWRDITNLGNSRTFIPAIIPKVGCGHTINLMFPNSEYSMKYCGLYGNLSSLVFDYVVRQKIGGLHLSYHLVEQLPVLQPEFYTTALMDFINPRVVELIYTSWSMKPFAQEFGYDGDPFPWDEVRRAFLRSELDALYAKAYGLDRNELLYVLDPINIKGTDYPSETFRVLKNNEIKEFNEYRTQRLVLEAWDRLESSGEFKNLGL